MKMAKGLKGLQGKIMLQRETNTAEQAAKDTIRTSNSQEILRMTGGDSSKAGHGKILVNGGVSMEEFNKLKAQLKVFKIITKARFAAIEKDKEEYGEEDAASDN